MRNDPRRRTAQWRWLWLWRHGEAVTADNVTPEQRCTPHENARAALEAMSAVATTSSNDDGYVFAEAYDVLDAYIGQTVQSAADDKQIIDSLRQSIAQIIEPGMRGAFQATVDELNAARRRIAAIVAAGDELLEAAFDLVGSEHPRMRVELREALRNAIAGYESAREDEREKGSE